MNSFRVSNDNTDLSEFDHFWDFPEDPSNVRQLATNLPQIQVNGKHLREKTDASISALLRANDPPKVFVRSGSLVRIYKDEKDNPAIQIASESMLRGWLARAANYVTIKERNGFRDITPVAPPLDVVRDIMALGTWPFPALESIVECPTLRPNGTVITDSGYDRETYLYYVPGSDLEIGYVPEKPPHDDLKQALSLICEVIEDFPFVDEASKANALGLIITPIFRPAIKGCVPLALIDSPQPGTGKTLLASIVANIATGHDGGVTTAPKNEEEWRKKITSTLIAGTPIITIDNITTELASDALAAAITTQQWIDRVLGKSENMSIPHRSTWIATGNNIRLGGDMPRRCYWIRLDAQISRPWEREGFRHPDLNSWILENRGQLISAFLILARGWYSDGKPDYDTPPLGSFSQWAKIIGNILAHAGVEGFLRNLEGMYDTTDEETPEWEMFLLALHEIFKREPVKTAQVSQKLEEDPTLRELIPEKLDGKSLGLPTPSFNKRLGKAFSKRIDMRHGDSQVRVEKTENDPRTGVARWKFVCSVCSVCRVDNTQKPDGYRMPVSELEEGETNPANPAADHTAGRTPSHYSEAGHQPPAW